MPTQSSYTLGNWDGGQTQPQPQQGPPPHPSTTISYHVPVSSHANAFPALGPVASVNYESTSNLRSFSSKSTVEWTAGVNGNGDKQHREAYDLDGHIPMQQYQVSQNLSQRNGHLTTMDYTRSSGSLPMDQFQSSHSSRNVSAVKAVTEKGVVEAGSNEHYTQARDFGVLDGSIQAMSQHQVVQNHYQSSQSRIAAQRVHEVIGGHLNYQGNTSRHNNNVQGPPHPGIDQLHPGLPSPTRAPSTVHATHYPHSTVQCPVNGIGSANVSRYNPSATQTMTSNFSHALSIPQHSTKPDVSMLSVAAQTSSQHTPTFDDQHPSHNLGMSMNTPLSSHIAPASLSSAPNLYTAPQTPHHLLSVYSPQITTVSPALINSAAPKIPRARKASKPQETTTTNQLPIAPSSSSTPLILKRAKAQPQALLRRPAPGPSRLPPASIAVTPSLTIQTSNTKERVRPQTKMRAILLKHAPPPPPTAPTFSFGQPTGPLAAPVPPRPSPSHTPPTAKKVERDITDHPGSESLVDSMFGGSEHTQRRSVAGKGKQKSDYEMHMEGEEKEKEKKEEGSFSRLEAQKRAEDKRSPEIEKAQLREHREMDTEKPQMGKAMSTANVDAEDDDEAEDADAVIQDLLIRSPSTPEYLPPLTGDALPDTIPPIASPTVSDSRTSFSNLPEYTHSSPLGDDDPLSTPPPDDSIRPVDRLFTPSLSAAVIPVDRFFIPSPLPPRNRALLAHNPVQASIVPAPRRRVFMSHISVPPFPEGVSKNDYRFPPQARRFKKQATTRNNASMSVKAKSDASAKSLLDPWLLKPHGKVPRAIKPTTLTTQSLGDTLAASWNHNATVGALPSFEKDHCRQSAEFKQHKDNFVSVHENADAGSSRLPISASQRPNVKDRKAELGLEREKASYQRLFGYARSKPDLDLVRLYFDACHRIPQSIVAMNTRHIRKELELDPANWTDPRRHWTAKQNSRNWNNQSWFRWPPALSAPSGSSTSETDEELYSLGGTVLEWDWDEESKESDEEMLPALEHRANISRTEARDLIPQHSRKRKREQDSDPESESGLESEDELIMIKHRKVSSDSQLGVRSMDCSVRQTNPYIPETVSSGVSDTIKDVDIEPYQPSAKALGKRKADDSTLTIVDPVDGPFPITPSTTRQRSTKLSKSSTIHASMVAVPLHASTSAFLPTFDLSNAESGSIITPYLSQQYTILSASGSPTNRHAIPGLRQSADENIFLTGPTDFQSEFTNVNKTYDSQWSLNEDPLDDSGVQFTATIDPMLLDGGEQLQDISFLHPSQSPDFSPRASLSPPRQTHSPTPSPSSSPSAFHTSSSSSGSSLRQTPAKEERSAEITLPQGGSSSEQTSVLNLSAIDVNEMHAAHSPESTGISEFRALSGSEYAESDANVGTSRRMSRRKPVPSRKRQVTPETSPTFDDEDYAAAKKPKKPPTAPRRRIAWPCGKDEAFCHVCRNRSKRLRMTCSCDKHFCNRCIINRFPEITFDDSGIDFTCPVCNDTCVCDLCTRKRGEEYISLRTERAAPRLAGRHHSPGRRQFDSLPPGRSHLGGKTNLPPISLHDLPLSSNLVTGPTMFWGTVYDLKGEKVATAFKLAADCAPETKTVVVRPVKYQPCSRHKRVFIGAVQSSWRFGSRPRVKDLKPYPRMSPQKKKCSPERLYVGKQWLLFVSAGSADTAGVLQQDREFSLSPLTPILSSPKSDSVAKVFSPNSLEDKDVQRAIFSALAAVNVSSN